MIKTWCLLILLFTGILLNAQPGSLDSTFDFDGKVLAGFGNADARIFDMVIQPDGKIVAGGMWGNIGAWNVIVARFNTDGSIDSAFGTAGAFINNFSPGNDIIRSVTLQPDGKIVASGEFNSPNRDILVLRFEPDGSLDSNFGTNGAVVTYINHANESGDEVVVTPSGKIVVGCGMSYGSSSDLGLICLNNDGSFDTTFNGTGKANYNFTGSEYLGSICIQPDNKIIAVGSSGGGIGFVARFNVNGSPDSTFNSTGYATGNFGTVNGSFGSVALLPNGKIIAGGSTYQSSVNNAIVARYNSNGSIDSSFNGSGYTVVSAGALQRDVLQDLTVQPDEKIVFVVWTSTINVFSSSNYFLARIGVNGILDSSFGTGGKVITDFANDEDVPFAISLQPDLKIVAAGGTLMNSRWYFSLARYFSGLNVGIIDLPEENFELKLYPNPVTKYLHINYELASNATVSIAVYDAIGRKVKTVSEKEIKARGLQAEVFELGNDLKEGVYIFKIEANKLHQSVRFVYCSAVR